MTSMLGSYKVGKIATVQHMAQKKSAKRMTTTHAIQSITIYTKTIS